MQAPEEVREPERGILRLRPLPLQAPHGDADVVQERRAVDLVVEGGSRGFLERGDDGPERHEVRRERGGAEAPEAVVVRGHAGLRRGDGVEMPAEIEVRALDLAELSYGHATCFRSR